MNENLRCFGEWVVILRTHGWTVSSSPTNHTQIPCLCLRQAACCYSFRLSWSTAYQISRFTTMTNNHIVSELFIFLGLINMDWVLCSVNGGAENLCHPWVQFDELSCICFNDILNTANNHACISYQESSWLYLEVQLAPLFFSKFFKSCFNRCTYNLRVCSLLLGNSRYFITPA